MSFLDAPTQAHEPWLPFVDYAGSLRKSTRLLKISNGISKKHGGRCCDYRLIAGRLHEGFADSVVARAVVAKPEDSTTANLTL